MYYEIDSSNKSVLKGLEVEVYMTDFENEIKNMSSAELQLILIDQRDLYTDKEIAIIESELALRNDFDTVSELADEELINQAIADRVDKDKEAEKKKETQRKLDEQKAFEERKEQDYQETLVKSKSRYGKLYEYKVYSFVDDGLIDVDQIQYSLNSFAAEGWRMKSSYTNEVGKESSSSGYAGYSSGTNSTICQHIIILERLLL